MQAASLATAYVPNPLRERVPQLRVIRRELTYIEDRIPAQATYRDDPIGHMHRRRMLDDVRFRAARIYQAKSEAMGIGTGRSPSDIREHVDGGQIATDGINDRMRDAARWMAHVRAMVGPDAHDVLEAVLIGKRRLREVEIAPGRAPGKVSTLAGRVLRTALMQIAKSEGLA